MKKCPSFLLVSQIRFNNLFYWSGNHSFCMKLIVVINERHKINKTNHRAPVLLITCPFFSFRMKVIHVKSLFHSCCVVNCLDFQSFDEFFVINFDQICFLNLRSKTVLCVNKSKRGSASQLGIVICGSDSSMECSDT